MMLSPLLPILQIKSCLDFSENKLMEARMTDFISANMCSEREDPLYLGEWVRMMGEDVDLWSEQKAKVMDLKSSVPSSIAGDNQYILALCLS